MTSNYNLYREREVDESSSVLFSPFTLSPPAPGFSSSSMDYPSPYRVPSSASGTGQFENRYGTLSSDSNSSIRNSPPILTSSIDGSTLITSEDAQRVSENERKLREENKKGWCHKVFSKLYSWFC